MRKWNLQSSEANLKTQSETPKLSSVLLQNCKNWQEILSLCHTSSLEVWRAMLLVLTVSKHGCYYNYRCVKIDCRDIHVWQWNAMSQLFLKPFCHSLKFLNVPKLQQVITLGYSKFFRCIRNSVHEQTALFLLHTSKDIGETGALWNTFSHVAQSSVATLTSFRYHQITHHSYSICTFSN